MTQSFNRRTIKHFFLKIRRHRTIIALLIADKNEDLLTKTNFLGCGFKSLGFRVLSLMGAE